MKHGLCASACVPEDLEKVKRRSIEFYETLKPQNELHVWMVEQASIVSIRIERSERIERRVRDKISLRAELTWDDDRRFDAELLGRSLGKDPSGTLEALRWTPHGCDWLMTRWAMLAYTADTQQVWTEAQTKLAFDLLGTPDAFRAGQKPGASIDLDGRLIDSADNSALVARRVIAALKERREVVADLDDVNRALASADLTNEGDPELRRLRRYESTLHSRYSYCLAQIKVQSPYDCPDRGIRPIWARDNEPILKPEPKSADEIAAEGWVPAMINPPFDLEPDEAPPPGAKAADIPAILISRREKSFRKADARRDAARRKIDKLCA